MPSPSDLPLRDVFVPLEWILAGLLAANFVLFAGIVIQREQWVMHERLRERTRNRVAPVIGRLLSGEDPERAAEELIAGLGAQAGPVAAWLMLDELREADATTHSVVRHALAESGAIELAERATRRWMPWRRALACELLGTIGTQHSVDVLIARLHDKRAEVRMAAARALGTLGEPAAAAALTELFLKRERVPIGVANDALSRLGAAGADAFRRGLVSPDPTVRVTSCFGIADQTDPAVREQARTLLEERLRSDDEPRVRSAAASAMRILPGDVAPRALLDALEDPAPAVRRSAAKSLMAFDDPAAVDALERVLADGDREAAMRSAESLLSLSGGGRAGATAEQALLGSRAWTVGSVRATAELGR